MKEEMLEEKDARQGFRPVTMALAKPLLHGEEEIREISFKRPLVVRDLRGIKVASLTFDDFALIAGRMANLPVSVVEQMSMPDFTRVMDIITSFLDGGPATGSRA